jgi:hypothetical protein
MKPSASRYFQLSLPRRWIGDLLYFARKIPSVPVERVMELGELQTHRDRAGISWPAIFLKAFGLTALRHPELRQALIDYPWPRGYEHSHSVASVAIERQYQGEPAVFFAQVQAPEKHGLRSIDRELKSFRNEPVESFGYFRRVIRFARLPKLVRRFAWWLSLYWSGNKRAKRLGTFGLSVYASLGASSVHPLSPLSYLLNYGVMDEQGRITVRLIYDHRIVDGAVIARALGTMESILNGAIQAELMTLSRPTQGSNCHESSEPPATERRHESLVSG